MVIQKTEMPPSAVPVQSRPIGPCSQNEPEPPACHPVPMNSLDSQGPNRCPGKCAPVPARGEHPSNPGFNSRKDSRTSNALQRPSRRDPRPGAYEPIGTSSREHHFHCRSYTPHVFSVATPGTGGIIGRWPQINGRARPAECNRPPAATRSLFDRMPAG